MAVLVEPPLPERTDRSLQVIITGQSRFQIRSSSCKQTSEGLSISGDAQSVAISAKRLTDGGDHTNGSDPIAITPTQGSTTR